jgi:catalase
MLDETGMSQVGEWHEEFEGGSIAAEHEIFLALADEIARVQDMNRDKAGLEHLNRTFHAKGVIGVSNATLVFDKTFPVDLQVDPYRPGSSFSTAVRLSNASGTPQSDTLPDMRGAAVRVRHPGGSIHDLLMTSFPASHARNARQFVQFALVAAGPREMFQARLIEAFGEAEARRILGNIEQGVRASSSLALETFWSRGAVLWGTAPVRFQLRPEAGAAALEGEPTSVAADALQQEFARRLRLGAVRYRLALQRYIDEAQTPIEDGTASWEHTSPPIEVATLIVPQQDLDADDSRWCFAEIEKTAFNPWNAPAAFRPLGNLNRARGVVYRASAARWGTKYMVPGAPATTG